MSNVVLANEEGSLIDQLSRIDVFHPPLKNEERIDLYNEWYYFNVIDEQQDLSFVTTLKLNGDIYDKSNFVSDPFISSANVLIDYHTPEGTNATIQGITKVKYSTKKPDLRMNSNTVKLTKDGYYVHVESSDGQTVFNALFKPYTELVPLFTILYDSDSYNQDMEINWLPASSKMKVTGTLTINKGNEELEKTYVLKNAKGYHDHNWGYWAWSDDIGWNWGQASESMTGSDSEIYTFSFGDITNNSHTDSKGAVLHLWKNKKMIADFNDSEIEILHCGMITPIPELQDNSFPLYTILTANDGKNSMSINFSTEGVTPIPISTGDNKFLVIWELTGTYEVSGCIDGNHVSYITKGFFEYVA